MRRLFDIKVIVAAYVALAAAYSLANLAFESPDEMAHFAYVKALADGRGFPDRFVVAHDAPGQESSQPPVYYALAALAVRVLAPDTGDFAAVARVNPGFPYTGISVRNDNRNVALHPQPEVFPFEGAVRGVHAARLIAIVFGAIAVWATYRLGRSVFPEQPAIATLAAASLAFTPQFVFISSSASNDSAVVAFCALSLWATADALRHGLTARRGAGLGVLLALAALSKASAVALAPLALLAVFAVDASGRTRPSQRLRAILVALLMLALVYGPWALHSLAVFGDVLGTSTHLAMPWVRPQPLPLFDTIAQLPDVLITFWLAFGWGNVVAADWVYALFNVLAVIGLIGAVAWLAGHRRRRALDPARATWQTAALIFMIAWAVVMAAGLVRWVQLLEALLGRLLFPALPALALIVAVGVVHLTRRAWLAAALPISLAAVSVLALPLTLLPAYTPPPLLSEAEVAQQAGTAQAVRFDDTARLIKVAAPSAPWPQPGRDTWIDVCWEALARDGRLLMTLVQITAQDERVVATRRTVPGLGGRPTESWQPGARFCDRVAVKVADDAPAPAVYHVEVALIDYATGQRLQAYGSDGGRLDTNFVEEIKLAPIAYAVPAVDHPREDRFGDQIALIGYTLDRTTARPGEAVHVRLYWQALRRPDRAYTVFAQLRDATGHIVTQADSQPQADRYPTSFWDAGEVVIDDRVLNLPPDAIGTLHFYVGLYVPDEGRLPVVDGAAPDEVQLPVELTVMR